MDGDISRPSAHGHRSLAPALLYTTFPLQYYPNLRLGRLTLLQPIDGSVPCLYTLLACYVWPSASPEVWMLRLFLLNKLIDQNVLALANNDRVLHNILLTTAACSAGGIDAYMKDSVIAGTQTGRWLMHRNVLYSQNGTGQNIQPAVSWVKKVGGAGSWNFPTDSFKFPTEKIMVL